MLKTECANNTKHYKHQSMEAARGEIRQTEAEAVDVRQRKDRRQ